MALVGMHWWVFIGRCVLVGLYLWVWIPTHGIGGCGLVGVDSHSWHWWVWIGMCALVGVYSHSRFEVDYVENVHHYREILYGHSRVEGRLENAKANQNHYKQFKSLQTITKH